MSNARERILARLRLFEGGEDRALPRAAEYPDWSPAERLRRFTERMTEVRAEVYRTTVADWPHELLKILKAKGVRNLLHGASGVGAAALNETVSAGGIELLPYEKDIEHWKQQLFESVDASLTGCRGAIAETGSLILWPDADEPRLISLVPPIHCVLLSAQRIYATFDEAMEAQGWGKGMPSNVLLISGPSKSADIAQVLAYGVHGPKSLAVLVVD